MTKGLVTVVLPIYGVEKYLDRSVESVVGQTYKNLEIILVDDGSKDNCPLMCDEWAKKDSRIRVIHKENAGLGMARNTGIENATGEYICFFDSDDYVDPQTVEKAYKRIMLDKSEAVIFGFNIADEKEKIIDTIIPPKDCLLYEGREVTQSFLPDLVAPPIRKRNYPRFNMSAWVLLYSLEAIRSSGWRFASERDIISEDVYSLLGFFSKVTKVSVLPEALYYYRLNEASVSRSYKKDRYKKVKHFYTESLRLCRELGYGDNIMRRVSKPYLVFTVSAMKQEFTVDRPKKESEREVRQIIDDITLQQVLQNNKKDKVSITRKILFFAMRHKLYRVCYELLKAKA